MTQETFDEKLKHLNDVEEQIKKLQESLTRTEFEVVDFLLDKFKTKEEFNQWEKENKVPGFVKLLMYHNYKNKEK